MFHVEFSCVVSFLHTCSVFESFSTSIQSEIWNSRKCKVIYVPQSSFLKEISFEILASFKLKTEVQCNCKCRIQ